MHLRKQRKHYEILVRGSFLEPCVEVRWTNRGRKRADEVEALIHSAWSERLADLAGKSLFAGPLCRLEGYSVVQDRLVLELGPTDYRELIGTNVCHPEIAERHGHDYLSNALAVHSTITTADGKILMFLRSDDVGEYPGAFDVCGGHIDPTMDLVDGAPNPFATLRRELEEEIELSRTDIDEVVCRGLVRNTATWKPDVLFDVWTSLKWTDFEQRRLDAEHRSVQYVLDSAKEIARFLRNNEGIVAPAGVASLELHLAN